MNQESIGDKLMYNVFKKIMNDISMSNSATYMFMKKIMNNVLCMFKKKVVSHLSILLIICQDSVLKIYG